MDPSFFSSEHACGSSLSIYGRIISDSDKWLRFLVSGVVCRHGQGTLDGPGQEQVIQGYLENSFSYFGHHKAINVEKHVAVM